MVDCSFGFVGNRSGPWRVYAIFLNQSYVCPNYEMLAGESLLYLTVHNALCTLIDFLKIISYFKCPDYIYWNI